MKTSARNNICFFDGGNRGYKEELNARKRKEDKKQAMNKREKKNS